MTGTIFNIQKFCLHDGPGIRTTVFFKGCNLRCQWCANPESQQMTHQLTMDAGKCAGCGSCVATCPQKARSVIQAVSAVDLQRCTLCGACIAACPAGAIGKEGRTVTVAEVVDEVMKDKPFYDRSGGGVTFSGGEVLLQTEFAGALADELRAKGVHVAIETAGAVESAVFVDFLEKVDFVLMDLKHYDSACHMSGTGADNRKILENIRLLRQSGRPFMVRIPVIPGYNDSLQDAQQFATLLAQLQILQVELLPFHRMGQHKYDLLGVEYGYAHVPPLPAESLLPYRQVFTQYGIEVKM